MTIATGRADDALTATVHGDSGRAAQPAASTVLLAASLTVSALRVAVREYPFRRELAERLGAATKTHRDADALAERLAGAGRPSNAEELTGQALDVAWLATAVADHGEGVFATSILEVRSDAITVCQLALAAVRAATVLVAEAGVHARSDPFLMEAQTCLARVRASERRVTRGCAFLAGGEATSDPT